MAFWNRDTISFPPPKAVQRFAALSAEDKRAAEEKAWSIDKQWATLEGTAGRDAGCSIKRLERLWLSGRLNAAVVRERNVAGHTITSIACGHGNLQLLQFLHEKQILEPQTRDAMRGDPPMVIACQVERLDVMQWLFAHGAADDVLSSHYEGPGSPTFHACRKGNLKILKWLHKVGADMSRRTSHGRPIEWAARFGHKSCVKFLLRIGQEATTATLASAQEGQRAFGAGNQNENANFGAAALAAAQANVSDVGHDKTIERLTRACAFCGKAGIKGLACGRCKAVCYCDKKCQKKHWRASHKNDCRPPAAAV